MNKIIILSMCLAAFVLSRCVPRIRYPGYLPRMTASILTDRSPGGLHTSYGHFQSTSPG
jgi:hypothetical protein